jgi:HEAT repeat protein
MASRAIRNLIIVAGVVLLLAQAVLVLAWWLLPRWQPEWVIQHSPWPEPALRAWRMEPKPRATTVFDRHHPIEERLMEWDEAIGPALVREFEQAEPAHRLDVMGLAIGLARQDGIAVGSELPDELRARWHEDQIALVREDLLKIAKMAIADGTSHLPVNASYVAMALRDERLVPLFCSYLATKKSPIFEDLEPVVRFLGLMRDPRAVPVLIPLLPIRHRTHATVEEALDRCQDGTTFPQIVTAVRHEHPVIRTWAAHQLKRYVSPRVAHPITGAVVLLRRAIAGATLLDVTPHEGDLFAQLAQLQAYGDIRFSPAAPYVRELASHADGRIRGVAIIALGALGDIADFPRLFALLHDDDEDIARKARIALDHLPLTPEQQRQVDETWEALEDDPELVTPSTSPASPAIPPVVP